MNTLDMIVVGVIAASALLAFFRGFVREVLAIGAWIGAIAAAYYLDLPTRGFFRSLISATWIADIVGPIVLFIVALVVFSILTGFLSSQMRNSQLNAIDRVLGLGFGAARGALIVCLAYIALNYFIAPDSRPPWIAQARTLPLLDSGSHELMALVPPDMMKRGGKTAEDVMQKAQAAQRMQQDMDAFTNGGPQQRSVPATAQDKPSGGGQNPPQQSANAPSTPPAYSDKMSNQMDQAVQAIQGKQ